MDHNGKIDYVGIVHVRMTAFANDCKYYYTNTACDGANRIDQDRCAPMTFVIDEFTDCSDQFHPRPMTAVTEDYGEDATCGGAYVTLLGNKIYVRDLKNEMTQLTAIRESSR